MVNLFKEWKNLNKKIIISGLLSDTTGYNNYNYYEKDTIQNTNTHTVRFLDSNFDSEEAVFLLLDIMNDNFSYYIPYMIVECEKNSL